MDRKKLDAELANTAAGFVPPSAASAATVDFDAALDLIRQMPEPTPEDLRMARGQEARHVLDRLPPYFRARDALSRAIHPKLLGQARAWNWGDAGMLFVGPTGVGKSTAAAGVFRRMIVAGWRDGGEAWERALRLRWFSAEALGRARREHPLGHGDAPELVKAARASLLFVDDAGWDSDPLAVSGVLAERYERGLPTILTSGRTEAELITHYGAAVMRRLTESGGKQALLVDCFEAA